MMDAAMAAQYNWVEKQLTDEEYLYIPQLPKRQL